MIYTWNTVIGWSLNGAPPTPNVVNTITGANQTGGYINIGAGEHGLVATSIEVPLATIQGLFLECDVDLAIYFNDDGDVTGGSIPLGAGVPFLWTRGTGDVPIDANLGSFYIVNQDGESGGTLHYEILWN